MIFLPLFPTGCVCECLASFWHASRFFCHISADTLAESFHSRVRNFAVGNLD